MALAVDFIVSRGPISKMQHQLQPKKTKVMLYHTFTRTYITAKDILPALHY